MIILRMRTLGNLSRACEHTSSVCTTNTTVAVTHTWRDTGTHVKYRRKKKINIISWLPRLVLYYVPKKTEDGMGAVKGTPYENVQHPTAYASHLAVSYWLM